jgi:hypothetical protein
MRAAGVCGFTGTAVERAAGYRQLAVDKSSYTYSCGQLQMRVTGVCGFTGTAVDESR